MSPVLRRLGRVLLGVVIASAVMAGICLTGVSTAMGESYAPRPGAAAAPRPSGLTVPEDRISVAVVLGATGTVATDALVPYGVFARSDRFSAYTIAVDRSPVTLSGGLHVLPDRTVDEATARPDVVVVPAVADPTGEEEAPLRAWIAAQVARGSHVLGVCDGARVLAATGLLDGRRATAHWSSVGALQQDAPAVTWVRGQRYVEDGPVTTTAGVTSGAVGALRLVERLAGPEEADRIGAALDYPGWTPDGDTAIPVHRWAASDLPYALGTAFPWLRPTIGLGLVDGVDEIDVAAAAEVWSGASAAARVVPLGAGSTVTTQHGIRLLVRPADAAAPTVDRLLVPGVSGTDQVDPRLTRWAADRGLHVHVPGGDADGRFGFDPLLRDLARHTDRATALATAKYLEYPAAHLDLAGPAWSWRSTALSLSALILSVGLGLVPTAVRRRRARRRTSPSG